MWHRQFSPCRVTNQPIAAVEKDASCRERYRYLRVLCRGEKLPAFEISFLWYFAYETGSRHLWDRLPAFEISFLRHLANYLWYACALLFCNSRWYAHAHIFWEHHMTFRIIHHQLWRIMKGREIQLNPLQCFSVEYLTCGGKINKDWR